VKEKRFYFRPGFCELDSFVAAAVVNLFADFFRFFAKEKGFGRSYGIIW
jgi:hypothetical protein